MRVESGVNLADILGPVLRRTITTLLLVSITWHTLLGAMPAVAAVCLGGGHAHAIDDDPAAAQDCEIDCQHSPGGPVPTPAQVLADNCGCIDIEITSIELLTALRKDLNQGPATLLTQVIGWALESSIATAPRRGPPPAVHPNAGCTQQQRTVRTTRLLL